jgi:hypothetical protein
MKERSVKDGVEARLKVVNDKLEQLERQLLETYDQRSRQNNEVYLV